MYRICYPNWWLSIFIIFKYLEITLVLLSSWFYSVLVFNFSFIYCKLRHYTGLLYSSSCILLKGNTIQTKTKQVFSIRERFLFGMCIAFDIFCFDFLLYNAFIVQIVFIYNIWLKYSSVPVLLKVALNTRKQTKPLPVIINKNFKQGYSYSCVELLFGVYP
jgi:hypothetical protein